MIPHDKVWFTGLLGGGGLGKKQDQSYSYWVIVYR